MRNGSGFGRKGRIMSEKRKRGRPKLPVHIEYKSISVPKEVWVRLFKDAKATGTSVGKLATKLIVYAINGSGDGELDPVQDDGTDF